jgi:hypothetical protein
MKQYICKECKRYCILSENNKEITQHPTFCLYSLSNTHPIWIKVYDVPYAIDNLLSEINQFVSEYPDFTEQLRPIKQHLEEAYKVAAEIDFTIQFTE